MIAKAMLTVAVILGLFWAIWLAGWLSFNGESEHPPSGGRGTTVEAPGGG